ncbi:hypothetical protein JHK82_019072 [Glycine max]|nr:hypothetical protein JHK85_019511 [Glycine max]KAG5143377.1 hypothetical protein JHK82_019072 [Glycine max]
MMAGTLLDRSTTMKHAMEIREMGRGREPHKGTIIVAAHPDKGTIRDLDIIFSSETCADTWIEKEVAALKEDGCPKVWVVTSNQCHQQAAHGVVGESIVAPTLVAVAEVAASRPKKCSTLKEKCFPSPITFLEYMWVDEELAVDQYRNGSKDVPNHSLHGPIKCHIAREIRVYELRGWVPKCSCHKWIGYLSFCQRVFYCVEGSSSLSSLLKS